jgi:hypothetical protein
VFRGCRLRHRLHVEEDGRDVDPGDAVDEGVMSLGHERETLPRQPLDEPQLPERLRAVELLGEHPRGHVAELLLRPRGRQRRMADVVLEVEGRVVDPVRPPGRGRGEGELLAEAGDEVEAPANVIEQVVVARRRALEDHHAAHVHVRRRALVREKGDVERAEAVHVSLSHDA